MQDELAQVYHRWEELENYIMEYNANSYFALLLCSAPWNNTHVSEMAVVYKMPVAMNNGVKP